METCFGPECNRPVQIIKWGLCDGHYCQQRNGRDLTPLRIKARSGVDCPVAWCDRVAQSRGLCRMHASIAWKMSIDPADYGELSRRGCDICGKGEAVLCFDHDHECCDGWWSCGDCLRGTLCHRCNSLVYARPDEEPYRSYIASPPGIETTYEPIRSDKHPGRLARAARG